MDKIAIVSKVQKNQRIETNIYIYIYIYAHVTIKPNSNIIIPVYYILKDPTILPLPLSLANMSSCDCFVFIP